VTQAVHAACRKENRMTPTDPVPPDTLDFGEPTPEGPFRRRNILAGLATVAVLAAAATGVALASTSTPTPSGSPSASPDGGTQKNGSTEPGGRGLRHKGFGLGRPGMLGGIEGPMGALHGQFVVPKQGGGYQTLVVQQGKVTSVSTSSITVKSADGFSATYAVPADTLVNAARDGIGSVKKGDDVSVLAQQKSGNDAALQIGDITRWQGMRDHFGPGPANRGTKPPTPPSPSTGSTGTTGASAFGV
jgi:hypothetical protein